MAAGFVLFLAGCAAPQQTAQPGEVPARTVQLPAKSNAAEYRRVAVLPFDGNAKIWVTDEFKQMLADAQYEGRPYFTLFDWRSANDVAPDLLQRSIAGTDPRSLTNFNPKSLASFNPKSLANVDPASLAGVDPKSLANLNPKSLASVDPKSLANVDPTSLANMDPMSAAGFDPASIGNVQPMLNTGLDAKSIAIPTSKSIVTYGKLTRADAVYSGTADVIPMTYTRSSAERMYCSTDKTRDCRKKEVRCTTKTAGFVLTPTLTDVRRGKVVYSETKRGWATSSWCDDAGVEVQDRILADQAERDAFRQVREDIAPYQLTLKLKYKDSKDGLDPRSVEPFDRALAFARAGRLDRACPIWSSFVASNPQSRSVVFDVALCDEFGGRLDAALAQYQRIGEASAPSDPDVSEAIARVRESLAARKSSPSSPSSVSGQQGSPALQ
jgi:hypothetical protein